MGLVFRVACSSLLRVHLCCTLLEQLLGSLRLGSSCFGRRGFLLQQEVDASTLSLLLLVHDSSRRNGAGRAAHAHDARKTDADGEPAEKQLTHCAWKKE